MLRFATYRERLERSAAAWFTAQGHTVQRTPYVLARWEDWPRNLLDPDLAALVDAERASREAKGEGFPLHKWLHHGLSSQAMLFNLVLPLLAREDVDALAESFRAAGAPWPGPGATARLEVEDRAIFGEAQAQPTSFDLCIEGPAGPPLLIEAKLVEASFGGCSLRENGDCDGENPARDPARCPLTAIGRRYWQRLDEHGFTDALAAGPHCALALHYQFFREAAFALTRGGHYILLVHADNPAFRRDDGARGLWPFLLRSVPERHRSRLQLVTLQHAADALQATGRHPWVAEFRERYALDPPAAGELAGVEEVLAALPSETACAIRRLWETAGYGGATGRTAQRDISRLLATVGIRKGDPRWTAIIEEGRGRYYTGR